MLAHRTRAIAYLESANGRMMRRTFCGLAAAVLLLPGIAWGKELLIENQSPRPFVYQIRQDNDAWGESLSIEKGFRHRYISSAPLVIRFRSSEGWTTYRLPPDRLFRFAPDAKGDSRLFDAGPVRDASTPPHPPVPGAPGDVQSQTPSPAGPDLRLREIKVLCLADDEYRRRFPEWKERIGEIVARVSRVFEATFALRFTMTQCRTWDYEAKSAGDPKEQIMQLLSVDPTPAELVIAFVGAIQAANTYRSGHLYYQQAWTVPFGQHVMISDINRDQPFAAEQLLAQCLCQVFGAFHVADRRSIMNSRLENVEPGPIRFGKVAEEVIWLTRGFDLRRGPASLKSDTIARIRELYRKYRHVESKPGDDPVTNGFRARRLYRKPQPPPEDSRTANRHNP